jgi:hypothetical protein
MAGMKNKDPNNNASQSWETFQGTYTYMSVSLIDSLRLKLSSRSALKEKNIVTIQIFGQWV